MITCTPLNYFIVPFPLLFHPLHFHFFYSIYLFIISFITGVHSDTYYTKITYMRQIVTTDLRRPTFHFLVFIFLHVFSYFSNLLIYRHFFWFHSHMFSTLISSPSRFFFFLLLTSTFSTISSS